MKQFISNNSQLFKRAKDLLVQRKFTQALQEITRIEEVLGVEADPLQRARMNVLWAEIAVELGQYREAMDRGEQAYEMLRSTATHREVGQVQRHMGRALLRLGEVVEAKRFLEDSVATFRRIVDEEEMLKSINALALACFITSRWDQAIQHLEYGLGISRRAGRSREVASFSGNLGTVHRKTGSWREAEEYLAESLDIYEQLGDHLEIARGCISLGRLFLLRRQWEMSAHMLERSKTLSTEHDFPLELAQSHDSLGELAFERGEYEVAIEHYRRALEIGQRIAPDGDIINQVQRRLGEVRLVIGEPDEARMAGEHALEVSQKLGDQFEEGCSYRVVGMAYEKLGQHDRAEHFLTKAVETLEFIGERFELGKTLLDLGKIRVANLGEYDESNDALAPLEKAEQIFRRLGAKHHLGLVQLVMARAKMADRSSEAAFRPLQAAERLFEKTKDREILDQVVDLERKFEKILVDRSFSAKEDYHFLEKMNQTSFEDLDDLLARVVERVGADRGIIALRERDNGTLKIESLFHISRDTAGRLMHNISKTLNGYKLSPGLPFMTMGLSLSRRFPSLKDENISGLMLVPFALEDLADGILYVDQAKESPSDPFGQREINFFTLLAHVVALRIGQIRRKELQQENIKLKQQLKDRWSFSHIITKNSQMKKILQTANWLKDTTISILIEGETGTGKEVLAKAIHHEGNRRSRKFVPVDCGAIPEGLFENELFGHRQGAFTGAGRSQQGLFEEAEGGTVFLDEIGNIGPDLQAKLLRVLQEGEVKRLGESKPRKVDVRVIAATNGDLEKEVLHGNFRSDLYFRLKGVRMKLQPLRDRREDIVLLVEHFIRYFAQDYGKRIAGISPEAMRALMNYQWPGNVRELKNELERAVILAKNGNPLTLELFSDEVISSKKGSKRALVEGDSPQEVIERVKMQMTQEALERCGGNRTKAARLLGITREGLSKRLRKYRMSEVKM